MVKVGKRLMLEQVFCLLNVQRGTAHTVHGRSATFKKGGQIFGGVVGQSPPRAGSGAVSKWVICACDSLVDFGTV